MKATWKKVLLWLIAYFTGELASLTSFPIGLVLILFGSFLFYGLFDMWFREK